MREVDPDAGGGNGAKTAANGAVKFTAQLRISLQKFRAANGPDSRAAYGPGNHRCGSLEVSGA